MDVEASGGPKILAEPPVAVENIVPDFVASPLPKPEEAEHSIGLSSSVPGCIDIDDILAGTNSCGIGSVGALGFALGFEVDDEAFCNAYLSRPSL
jgi:hypothetical protein